MINIAKKMKKYAAALIFSAAMMAGVSNVSANNKTNIATVSNVDSAVVSTENVQNVSGAVQSSAYNGCKADYSQVRLVTAAMDPKEDYETGNLLQGTRISLIEFKPVRNYFAYSQIASTDKSPVNDHVLDTLINTNTIYSLHYQNENYEFDEDDLFVDSGVLKSGCIDDYCITKDAFDRKIGTMCAQNLVDDDILECAMYFNYEQIGNYRFWKQDCVVVKVNYLEPDRDYAVRPLD